MALKLNKMRDLTLSAASAERPAYVYSASGLLDLKNEYVIVADDESCLAVFPHDLRKPGRWIKLFSDELPLEYKARKKKKPDLESLCRIPASTNAPSGALLAVPSLSRENRVRGALIFMQDDGTEQVIPLDFSTLRQELARRIKELNIEGIVIGRNFVRLFHRGSQGTSDSAIIDLALEPFMKDVFDTHSLAADKILSIKNCQIGLRENLTLAFTDAACLPDGRIVFLAAAEASKNAYDDGESAGSAAGIMSEKGEIERLEHFDGSLKLEGVAVHLEARTLRLKLVADADDESKPSALYEAVWQL